jgi:hypothetical protein
LRDVKLTEPKDNLVILTDMVASGLKVDSIQLRQAK